MKKISGLFIMLIFIFSLVPVAFADEEDDRLRVRVSSEDSDGNKAETRNEIRLKNNETRIENRIRIEAKGELKEDYKARLKLLKESHRAKIESLNEHEIEALSNLSSERLQKIAELDKRQIERLSELNIRNLEKITSLKAERLKRLAELEKEKLERISELNESEIEKISGLNRARLNDLAKLGKDRLKLELKSIHVIKVKNAAELKKKNLTLGEIARLRERFENARQKFDDAKDEMDESRESLQEAKKKRDANATFEHSKAYVIKSAEAMISHLEKLKLKIQENENINGSTEARIVAQIDVQISEIAQIKAEAEASTTKEQIKEAASKLRAKWGRLQNLIKFYSDRIVAARVRGIVNQGLVLEKRIENILQKAEEKGIDVNVSAELDMFSTKIELSTSKHQQAQAKLSEAFELRLKVEPADSEKVKSLMEGANKLLKESREAIKEAHEVLKELVKKIRDAYPEADLSSDIEVEVEDE